MSENINKNIRDGYFSADSKRESRQASRIVPMSYAQQRMWFLEQLEPDSVKYNISQAFNIKSKLSVDSLKRAFEKVVERHESLRTVFDVVYDQPVQIIMPDGNFKFEIMEFIELPKERQDEEILGKIKEDFMTPFNLANGPLMRVKLIKIHGEEFVLIVGMHHAISDDLSIRILMKEIFILYLSYISSSYTNLPELNTQYSDFAIWQRNWLKSGGINNEISYWKQKLANCQPIQLPLDFQRPHVITSKGALVRFGIPEAVAQKVKILSNIEGATVYMTLLTAYISLLYRYTGQGDICVGTPFSERKLVDFESLIGLFINTLVIRTVISGGESFRVCLNRVKQSSLEAFDHCNIPFEKIVEEIQPERTLDNNPLFQVMFSYYNSQNMAIENKDISINQLEVDNQTSKFDLTLYVTQNDRGLEAVFEYNVDLFRDDTIERMAEHFNRILAGAVEDPDCLISKLPMLSESEFSTMVFKWNDTDVDYPADKGLQYIFEEQVRKFPLNIALVYGNSEMTYSEFNCCVNRLANYLRKLGIGPGIMAGICLERSFDMVTAIHAVVKAGGAYVPFDPSYPKERLQMIYEDSEVPVILTCERFKHMLPQKCEKIVCLDLCSGEIEKESGENPSIITNENNPAYVIFTSGSTGRPKGVMNVHRGIYNRLMWMQDKYRLEHTDVVMQKTPFSFDVSVWEFFWPLLFGACLIIAKPEGHKDPSYLIDLIREKNVTTIHFVPSMLRAFLDNLDVGKCDSLKRVICSGEALTVDLQDKFFEVMSSGLYNLYGPTEASIDVTYWDCLRNHRSQTIPIGRPIANTQMYILDACLNPLPVGVPGELHIGGAGLAWGYVKHPEHNAVKFIKNPFTDKWGGYMYKTGDLAKYLPDGNIEFLGRIDNQVKIRGLRIELGEIESVIKGHPDVSDAVVVLREDKPGEKEIAAYLVYRTDELEAEYMKNYLREKLPEYMIPSFFVTMERLPFLTSGKIDRKSLPKPDKMARSKEYIAPRTELEKIIAGIWQEVLGVEKIGIDDNFFDVGGHSLLLLKVHVRLKQVARFEISTLDLFRYTTISSLTGFLNNETESEQEIMEKSKTRADFRRQSMEQSVQRRRAARIMPD